MYISYKGDVANAYLNGNLIGDSFYDGTEWILSLSRLKESIDTNPMVIRIDGLKSADVPIYFEKNVVPADWCRSDHFRYTGKTGISIRTK